MDPDADLKVMQVGDLQEPFTPFPAETFLLNVQTDRERIDAFLDKLITIYHTEEKKKSPIQTCMGAAMSSCK